jgi:phenol hydroxylase P1 protein
MNNDFIAAYGYGTGITQPALYYARNQPGIAQFDTRLGLLLADPDALEKAKHAWLSDVRWQSLRRLVEDLFVEQDWFELFVAQDLVLDGLLYPLVFQAIIDDDLALRGGAAVAMVTQFQNEWAAETCKWVDVLIMGWPAPFP